MKTQLLAATLIAMGAGLGATATGQEGQEAREVEVIIVRAQRDRLAVLPVLRSVDTNDDGMVDMTESDTLTEVLEEGHGIEFQFEAVDSNRDGLINDREYAAYDSVLRDRLGIA